MNKQETIDSMTKLTGGQVNYYLVQISHPRRDTQSAYQAECEDIISALNMTFDEGCLFKALWRSAAARKGNGKPGHSAVYDAEKMVHYANQILRELRNQQDPELSPNRIEWDGGECPVPESSLVSVWFRDGAFAQSYRAGKLCWIKENRRDDIIAYRLV